MNRSDLDKTGQGPSNSSVPQDTTPNKRKLTKEERHQAYLRAVEDWIASGSVENPELGRYTKVRIFMRDPQPLRGEQIEVKKKMGPTGNESDRIRGCLMGVAVGDALGAPFEHLGPLPQEGILEETGGLIADFHHGSNSPAGAWTDDTGLTLATCRAFIQMHRTSKGLDECIRAAQEAWAGSDEARKPGRTVLYAAKYGEPVASSWANGALMRISPVAIYGHLRKLSKEETATMAYRIARTTHGHPLAVFPAVECTLAILSILSREETVPGDLFDPGRYCRDVEPEQYTLYREHRTLPLDKLDPTCGLWMWRYVFEHSLGLAEGMGWDHMPEFEPGILKAVNEGVDKDTAGAVAGAILGAYWGNSRIPGKWRSRVWRGAEVIDLANEMIRTVAKDSD